MSRCHIPIHATGRTAHCERPGTTGRLDLQPVRLLTRTIDRNRELVEAELGEGLERLVPHRVQVDAVVGQQPDVLPVGILDDLVQVRIQEDLAPVGELDARDPGILIDDLLEVGKAEEARPDLLSHLALGSRAGGALQLAGRRCLQAYASGPDASLHSRHPWGRAG